MSKAAKMEVKDISRILVLIGGILLIVFGLYTVLGGSLNLPSYLGFSVSGSILGIIVGVIALIGYTRIRELVWAVLLAVLGWYVGGIGGLLVLLGALLALIMRIV